MKNSKTRFLLFTLLGVIFGQNVSVIAMDDRTRLCGVDLSAPINCDDPGFKTIANWIKKEPSSDAGLGSFLSTFIYSFKAFPSFSGWTWALARIDEHHFAATSESGVIRVLNWVDETCIRTLTGHRGRVNALVRLDNGTLASASNDGTIKIWNLDTGVCLQTLAGHKDRVTALVQLKNRNVVSASTDGTIKVWYLGEKKPPLTIQCHIRGINAMVLSDDGTIVTASSNGEIKVWDVDSGNLLCVVAEGLDSINTLLVLPDNKIAAGLWSGEIVIFDECGTRRFVAHDQSVNDLVIFAKDCFASASNDGSIKFWNIESLDCLQTIKQGDYWVNGLLLLDAGFLVSTSSDCTIRLWDTRSEMTFAQDDACIAMQVLLVQLKFFKEIGQKVFLHEEWVHIFESLPVDQKNRYADIVDFHS